MSEDARQELEAAGKRLAEKTAEASDYLQENERLQVQCCLCSVAVLSVLLIIYVKMMLI